MRFISLFILIFLSGCADKYQPPQSKEYVNAGDPEKLLMNHYGEIAFINSLNFYITNNPWYESDEYALSLHNDIAFLIRSNYLGKDQFTSTSIKLDLNGCKNAKLIAEDFKSKYYGDSKFIIEGLSIRIDGPTYTLREYDKSGNMVIRNNQRWPERIRLDSLGEDLIYAILQCNQ